MKIHTVNPLRPNAPRRSDRAQQGGGSGFARALQEERVAPGTMAGAGQIGTVNALLALQEVEDPLDRDRQAEQRGRSLLDQLDELRLELLLGNVPRARLLHLSNLLSARRTEAADPRLAGVIAEIELRAAVELAKLER